MSIKSNTVYTNLVIDRPKDKLGGNDIANILCSFLSGITSSLSFLFTSSLFCKDNLLFYGIQQISNFNVFNFMAKEIIPENVQRCIRIKRYISFNIKTT